MPVWNIELVWTIENDYSMQTCDEYQTDLHHFEANHSFANERRLLYAPNCPYLVCYQKNFALSNWTISNFLCFLWVIISALKEATGSRFIIVHNGSSIASSTKCMLYPRLYSLCPIPHSKVHIFGNHIKLTVCPINYMHGFDWECRLGVTWNVYRDR